RRELGHAEPSAGQIGDSLANQEETLTGRELGLGTRIPFSILEHVTNVPLAGRAPGVNVISFAERVAQVMDEQAGFIDRRSEHAEGSAWRQCDGGGGGAGEVEWEERAGWA